MESRHCGQVGNTEPTESLLFLPGQAILVACGQRHHQPFCLGVTDAGKSTAKG